MGERVRLASSHSKHQLSDKSDKFLKDRISLLPDEVIVSILSLLQIREAARTSVLAHRWERLWNFYTGSLNLDDPKTLYSLPFKSLKKERSKYVGWVNRVLASLGGSSVLDDFRVRFDLNIDSSRHIDRWIEFALEKKRVKRFELNLEPKVGGYTDASERYNFPLECYVRIKQPRGLYNISALTSIHFEFVNVCGELLEHFLSTCPRLERLFVRAAEQLENLKVTGATLQLKYLTISQCCNLKLVEIHAPNLVYLIYYGKEIDLNLKYVPRLVDVSIGGSSRYSSPIPHLCRCISSYFSQLETLKLRIDREETEEFMQYLELTKLKHLILSVTALFGESLLKWSSLLNAAPFLHRFTLELSASRPSNRGLLKRRPKRPHQYLKVLEIVGFVGCATDIEFAIYFLEKAITLEKIILDCSGVVHFDGKRFSAEESVKKAAKRDALRLKRNIPSGVNLVVI